LKGTLLLKEKLSLALETYKEKLSLSVLKTVTHGETILFQPEGVYDMAVVSFFLDLLTQTVLT
jgi:hypothetical protein